MKISSYVVRKQKKHNFKSDIVAIDWTKKILDNILIIR
jgi:hypothetical protein